MEQPKKPLKSCPFCGSTPEIGPKDPEAEGDAFAWVACHNEDCPANPHVEFYDVDDSLCDPDKCKAEAINLWNTRT